jgi:hypothetical protein
MYTYILERKERKKERKEEPTDKSAGLADMGD